MNRIITILILFTALSLAFCDVRVSGASLAYMPGNLGAGHPRLAEVLALLSTIIVFIFVVKNKQRNSEVKNGRKFFFICFLLMAIFALFKPAYMSYLRSACFIPTIYFLAISSINITEEQLVKLFKIILVVISVSAVFVVISPYFDLGVQRFYIDIHDDTAQRYLGFGTSLPYQAAFNLCAIPLYHYLFDKEKDKVWKTLLIGMLILNLAAIILTGVRTAYIIIILLVIYYYNYWKKYISTGVLIPIIIVGIIAFYYVGTSITRVFSYRNEANLAGRDVVWLIGIQLIITHPVLGIQDFFKDGRAFGSVIAHVQNGFFEIAFWGGLLALILYVTSFWYFYLAVKKKHDLKKLYVSIMIIFFIMMNSEILFYSVQAYYLILMIVGLLLANYQTSTWRK